MSLLSNNGIRQPVVTEKRHEAVVVCFYGIVLLFWIRPNRLRSQKQRVHTDDMEMTALDHAVTCDIDHDSPTAGVFVIMSHRNASDFLSINYGQ